MTRKSMTLLLIAIFISATSFSQQKWTLQECISYALENNIDIKSFKLSLKDAEISNLQAKLDYIPQVNGNVGYSFGTGRVLDPTTYTFVESSTVNNINTGISANVMLFAGLQKYNNLKKTAIELDATKSELLQLENNTSLNVSLFFLQILLNKEVVASVEKQVESSAQSIERMKVMVDNGAATLGDLLNLEAQKANEEYTLADAQTRLNTSIIELCQLMALSSYENFDVETPVFQINTDVSLMRVDSIFDVALSLPEITGKQKRYDASVYSLKGAKSAYYPRLSANYGYSTSYSDSRKKVVLDENNRPVIDPDGNLTYTNYAFLDQLKDNQYQSISVSLSIPIFTSLNVRNNVKKARLNLQRSGYDIENARNKLYKDVNQAVNDVTGAKMQYQSAIAKVTSNQEALNYTTVKFQSGASTITDYVLAKNNIMIAEAQMAQAKYTYIFKLEVINYYLGKGIGLE